MSGGVKGSSKPRIIAGGGIRLAGKLSKLSSTRGVIFPYTPTIQFSHSANYGTYDTTHSVYQTKYWINTPNPTIQITAQFTAQTNDDAEYSAAALHFFKAATKGDFGERATNPGLPPPVLKFSGYGDLHAAAVPIVIGSMSYTLPEDIDYVETSIGAIPVMFIVSLDLAVQHAPVNVRRGFSASGYQSGSILKNGFI